MQSKVAFMMLLGLTFAVPAWSAPPPATDTAVAASAPPAALTLGDEIVLRLRASAGGMTPQQRVSVIEGRLAAVLGSPQILPADVTIYTPKGRAPVIYALGRRLITVDDATVRSAGDPKATPLIVATRWAKRFQQVLPRVNWRPSNAPETVVPANPPLTVTDDFTKVGGNVGSVTLRGKTVIVLHGPQHGGLTAQERADLLTARLERFANGVQGADAVSVVTAEPQKGAQTGSITVDVAAKPLLTVETAEAKIAKVSLDMLAAKWAANIRAALGLPDPDALPAAVSGTPMSPAAGTTTP